MQSEFEFQWARRSKKSKSEFAFRRHSLLQEHAL
jgi:hypothetical protein